MAPSTPSRHNSASEIYEADASVTVLGAKLRNVVAKASLAELQVHCWLETAAACCSDLTSLF